MEHALEDRQQVFVDGVEFEENRSRLGEEVVEGVRRGQARDVARSEDDARPAAVRWGLLLDRAVGESNVGAVPAKQQTIGERVGREHRREAVADWTG
jgi:hypothetical protein